MLVPQSNQECFVSDVVTSTSNKRVIYKPVRYNASDSDTVICRFVNWAFVIIEYVLDIWAFAFTDLAKFIYGGPDSIPRSVSVDLWWTKCLWDRCFRAVRSSFVSIVQQMRHTRISFICNLSNWKRRQIRHFSLSVSHLVDSRININTGFARCWNSWNPINRLL